MSNRAALKKIWVLMATVFVDMLGFFIVLPLLPFYAEKLGADPIRVGALVSMFALAQLVSAPLWGRLSDSYGRRPMILLGLLVAALAYSIFEVADAVWLLFLSRFVQGAASGTTGVIQAYVSDSIDREDRAMALGWLTAATSAGVMLGPVVGSLAVGRIGPGYLAAAVCLLNFAFGWRWLPEAKKATAPAAKKKGATRKAILEFLRYPNRSLPRLVWIYTFGMMAFMAMNGIFALYLERVFGIDERSIGWFFMYVGGISLVMRSLLLGPAVKWLGERKAMRAGALLVALGMALAPFAESIWLLCAAITFVPCGTALLFPTTTSLVSARAPEGQTGMILGVQQSFGGVSRMLGPIWAGAVFQFVGIRWPFWLASILMAIAFLMAGGIGGAGESAADAGVAPEDAPVVPS